MVDKDKGLKEHYTGRLRNKEVKKSHSNLMSNSKLNNIPTTSLNLLENCMTISSYTTINANEKSSVINLTENFFKFVKALTTNTILKGRNYDINKKSKIYTKELNDITQLVNSLITFYNLKGHNNISIKFGSKINNKQFTDFFIIKIKNFLDNLDVFTLSDALYFNMINSSSLINSINYIFQQSNHNILKSFKIDILLGLTKAKSQFDDVDYFNALLDIKDIQIADEIKLNKNYLNILTSKATTTAYLHFINTAIKDKREPYEIKTIIDTVNKCIKEVKYYKAPFTKCLYGLTLYDKSMIINKLYLDELKLDWSSECIVLMTIIHEFAHYLYRILVDSNFFNDSDFFDGTLRINESGDYIDKLLISNTSILSLEGSDYYMEVENWNCEYNTFCENFLLANKSNSNNSNTFKFKKSIDDKRLCIFHMH